MNRTFPGLDALRALLAFYLVLFHTLPSYKEYGSMRLYDVFGFGGYATSTFFVLSGFILSHIYIGAEPRRGFKVSASRFFIKRFSSLYPIHIFTMLLTVALTFLSSHPNDTLLQTIAPQTRGADEAVLNLIMQLLLLQAWNPFYLSYNIPAWSISTLMFFYLVFPVFAPRLMRMSNKTTMLFSVCAVNLVVALVAVLEKWYGIGAMGILHTNALLRLPEFLAGILAYGVFVKKSDEITDAVARHWHCLLFFLTVIFCIASYVYANGSHSIRVLLHNGAMLPTQIIVVIVFACLLRDASAQSREFVRRLGNASLSIFALQSPLFDLYAKAEKILDLPFPILSCLDRLHLCAHIAGGIPLRFSFYPIFLVLFACAAIAFQEKVVAPMRTHIRRVLTREKVAAVSVHPVVSSD
ncbi:acyltransferase family protein [Paraburkholderia franconis]|uniref:acyltransferase family protein n=1 Tax=Paraburkholderia franconis TaxID=2654983 RepID=UPI00128B2A61|nr:acyltransferase [Paraburkholderia franconis]